MISTDGLSLSQPHGIGDATELSGSDLATDPLAPHPLATDLLGPSGVFEPTFDLDSDGHDETATIYGSDAMSVVSDFDSNGSADHITEFGHDGRYESWDLIRLANGSDRWESRAHDDLGS